MILRNDLYLACLLNMTNQFPWRLSDSTFDDVRNADLRVAVIPTGSTEPHNLHLPYSTDVLEATVLGDRICEEAFRRGAKVTLLPPIPFGVQTNMRRLPLAININPATLDLFLTDIIHSLRQSGIEKILIFNSHGGNDFKPLLRTLAGDDITVFLCDWFRMVQDVYASVFDQAEDHAGEMETSLLLAHYPDLVRRAEDGKLVADNGQTKNTRFEAVDQGWIQITRRWDLLTANTGSGDPHAATAEKGHRITEIIVDRVATFLCELSDAELTDSFPFEN